MDKIKQLWDSEIPLFLKNVGYDAKISGEAYKQYVASAEPIIQQLIQEGNIADLSFVRDALIAKAAEHALVLSAKEREAVVAIGIGIIKAVLL